MAVVKLNQGVQYWVFGRDFHVDVEVELHDEEDKELIEYIGNLPNFTFVDKTEQPFNVDKATHEELDAQFGEVEGYPAEAKIKEKREFVKALLEAEKE